jgi:hypothetical protein
VVVPEAGSLDSGNPFPDFFVDLRSNIPRLLVLQDSEMGLTQLRMTSSNLQRLSGGGVRWFAEIRNGASDSWCNPDVIVRFLDNDGMTLWQGEAEVRSMPHWASGGAELVPCVAPGDTAIAWAVDLEAPAIDPNQIVTIGLRFGGDAFSGTTPHPATPQIEGIEVHELPADAGVGYVVSGALRGMVQPVAYAAVEVFSKNEQGFIFEVFRMPKTDPSNGTLEPDELWEFESPVSPDPIAGFRSWVSFEP